MNMHYRNNNKIHNIRQPEYHGQELLSQNQFFGNVKAQKNIQTTHGFPPGMEPGGAPPPAPAIEGGGAPNGALI